MPPMMIFKRKQMSELLLKGIPRDTIGGVSENGWRESELFIKWLEHFVHHVQPSEYRKVLSVLDGHASHKLQHSNSNRNILVSFKGESKWQVT